MSTLQVSMDIYPVFLSFSRHSWDKEVRETVSNSHSYFLRATVCSVQQARGKSLTLEILKVIQVEIALTSLVTG